MKNTRNSNGETEFVIFKKIEILLLQWFLACERFTLCCLWNQILSHFWHAHSQHTILHKPQHWCVCNKSNDAVNSTCSSNNNSHLPTIHDGKKQHIEKKICGGALSFLCIRTPKNEKWFYRCKISFPLAIQLKNGNQLVATVSNACISQNCLCLNWWKIIFLLRWEWSIFAPAE